MPLGTAIAGRTAAYGRACFAWAMKRGTVTSNPFAELPMPNSITRRERVLTDEEAAAIWRAAGEAPLPYGAIVRLLMLTGQRREEVALTWAELRVLNHLSGSRAGVVGFIKARLGRETRRTRRVVCAPSRRGGRRAACRKGVAV